MRGRLSIREDRANSVLVDEALPLLKGQKYRRGRNFTQETLPLKQRVMEILRRYPGSIEVVFADAVSGKKYIAPKELWVNSDPRLLTELSELLGEKNVALVQKRQ